MNRREEMADIETRAEVRISLWFKVFAAEAAPKGFCDSQPTSSLHRAIKCHTITTM